jgi:hypothetical protein
MELSAGHIAILSASEEGVCELAVMVSLAQSCSMTSVECAEETTPVVQRLLEPSIKKGNVIKTFAPV